MIVFIDECGDPGFKLDNNSSKYFIISLIIFEDAEKANQADELIGRLHREMGIKQEFKFCHDSKRIKTKFFEEIQCCDFMIEVIVVDKELISSAYMRDHPKSFYNFILKQVISHSRIADAKAKIILDGKGNKHFVQELKSYLRKDTYVKIKSFSLKDSKKDNLLQLADYVAGGIMCFYKHGDDCYKKALGRKIVNIWPFR